MMDRYLGGALKLVDELIAAGDAEGAATHLRMLISEDGIAADNRAVAFTLDTYAHAMPGQQADAAATVAFLVDAAK